MNGAGTKNSTLFGIFALVTAGLAIAAGFGKLNADPDMATPALADITCLLALIGGWRWLKGD
jgi:hypothetical protein